MSNYGDDTTTGHTENIFDTSMTTIKTNSVSGGGGGSDGGGGGSGSSSSGGGNDIDTPSSSPVRQRRPINFCRTTSMSSVGDDFDNDFVNKIVRDSGQWAYGTVIVEVWVMNKHDTHLERVEGGFWMDPKFHKCKEESDSDSDIDSDDDDEEEEEEKEEEENNRAQKKKTKKRKKPRKEKVCHVCRLINEDHPKHIQAQPVCPGVGLPGALWAEINHDSLTPSGTFTSHHHHIVWREVKPLSEDPHQPFDPRLKLLADCRIGFAAAVPFYFEGAHGIVVYMTREGIQSEKIQSVTNETYLRSSAHLIGSAFALRGPRQDAMKERRQEFRDTLRTAKAKISSLMSLGIISFTGDEGSASQPVTEISAFSSSNHDDTDHDDIEEGIDNCCITCQQCNKSMLHWKDTIVHHEYTTKVTKKIKTYSRKLKGSGVHPPPSFDNFQTVWAFFGAFITLLVLTRFSAHLVDQYGSDHAIVLGPMGAFLTLVFGLTAAPAAQPKNAMGGQLVAMVIAMIISIIPGIDDWIKQSLATSLAIASMVKWGLTHPPAGASAMLFSTGRYGVMNMTLTMIANLLAIVMAAAIQDWNNERQYPTFWGIHWFHHHTTGRIIRYINIIQNTKQQQQKQEQATEKRERTKNENNNNNNHHRNNHKKLILFSKSSSTTKASF